MVEIASYRGDGPSESRVAGCAAVVGGDVG